MRRFDGARDISRRVGFPRVDNFISTASATPTATPTATAPVAFKLIRSGGKRFAHGFMHNFARRLFIAR
ncbi:MAG: hypothetical protein NVSMB56_00910 [Pyrinomonadaceae bacterium]